MDTTTFVPTMGMWTGSRLFEVCFDRSEERSSFAVRREGGSIQNGINLVDVGNVTYCPDAMSDLSGKVSLASRAEEPCDLGDVMSYLYRNTYLKEERTLEIVARYALLTWRFDFADIFPSLHVYGMHGTGKTTLLSTLQAICFRSISFPPYMKEKAILRLYARVHGTAILDEYSELKAKRSEGLHQLVLFGDRPAGQVKQVVELDNNRFAVEAFDVFGPKITSSMRKLEFPWIDRRCIQIELKHGGSRVSQGNMAREAAILRNMLLGYRLSEAPDNWRTNEEVQALFNLVKGA